MLPKPPCHPQQPSVKLEAYPGPAQKMQRSPRVCRAPYAAAHRRRLLVAFVLCPHPGQGAPGAKASWSTELCALSTTTRVHVHGHTHRVNDDAQTKFLSDMNFLHLRVSSFLPGLNSFWPLLGRELRSVLNNRHWELTKGFRISFLLPETRGKVAGGH